MLSCTYEKYGDSGNAQNWEVGEGITITEGSADDCTAKCNVGNLDQARRW